MYKGHKVYAVLLAAGSGSRMNSETKKQFMELKGRSVFSYSLNMLAASPYLDSIVLVTGREDMPEMRARISRDCTELRGKLRALCCGGTERWNSVYKGLQEIRRLEEKARKNSSSRIQTGGMPAEMAAPAEEEPFVLIHDSARPMLNMEMIEASLAAVEKDGACCVGMPVKDTVKLLDENNYVRETPERKLLWQIQTPQSFSFPLILAAYERLSETVRRGENTKVVTDDAMVAEEYANARVRIIPGSYRNIKITTIEDLPVAEIYLSMEEEFGKRRMQDKEK